MHRVQVMADDFFNPWVERNSPITNPAKFRGHRRRCFCKGMPNRELKLRRKGENLFYRTHVFHKKLNGVGHRHGNNTSTIG